MLTLRLRTCSLQGRYTREMFCVINNQGDQSAGRTVRGHIKVGTWLGRTTCRHYSHMAILLLV